MRRIIEGVWDCAYCGTKRIRGAIRECPNCGHPRDAEVKFYISDPNNYVSAPEKVNRNPDWICPYCKSLNSDSVNICKSCGSPRSESTEDYFHREIAETIEEQHDRIKRLSAAVDTGRCDVEEETASERRYYAPLAQSKVVPESKFGNRFLWRSAAKKAVVFFLILALLAGLVWLFVPHTKALKIDEKSWYRRVDIERYGPVSESGWSLPVGAYDISTRREIHHYDHRLDHYETKTRQVPETVFDGYDTYYTTRDLGNGYFEQEEHQTPRYRTEYRTDTYEDPVYVDVPIYETKFYYTIDKWSFDHSEETSAADDEPYFADYKLGENERFGDKSEKYWFTYEENKYAVDYYIWQQYNVGDQILAKVRFGKVLEILEKEIGGINVF